MLQKLNKYYEDGLLYRQVHPTLSLTIWNYTEKVQYENLWDEITLMCRGLVTDDEGNIVARPFKKFFNIEENKYTPTSEFDVYEKMDGSLGILFNYKGEWIFASRGSFTSDQAIKFKEIFYRRYKDTMLSKKSTYLFEIIYPENRIVVDYGNEEDIVMLGEIRTSTGEELDLEYNIQLGFYTVMKYSGINDYTQLKQIIDNNAEGFVVRFSNGDRIKIKGEEYLRLHKIMTNLSTTAVWEHLKEGGDINDLLKDVPDEFYKKIKNYESELRYTFYRISEDIGKTFDYKMYGKYNDKEPLTGRKEFAEWVQTQPKHYQGILFRMFDKRNYSELIWKLLKPEFKKL